MNGKSPTGTYAQAVVALIALTLMITSAFAIPVAVAALIWKLVMGS